MEREGMSLHDAVGINCKNSATTENKGSGAKYNCVCVYYLTWHDYPSLVEGESHGILVFFIIKTTSTAQVGKTELFIYWFRNYKAPAPRKTEKQTQGSDQRLTAPINPLKRFGVKHSVEKLLFTHESGPAGNTLQIGMFYAVIL